MARSSLIEPAKLPCRFSARHSHEPTEELFEGTYRSSEAVENADCESARPQKPSSEMSSFPEGGDRVIARHGSAAMRLLLKLAEQESVKAALMLA